MTRKTVLATARFDSKLRTYLFMSVVLAFVVSIIGIVLLPLVIPFALLWSRRYFDALSCTLTP